MKIIKMYNLKEGNIFAFNIDPKKRESFDVVSRILKLGSFQEVEVKSRITGEMKKLPVKNKSVYLLREKD